MSLVLRWSWRDLRRRWALVVAVSAVIAIGTGMFAGLGGTNQWRVRSYDASYADLALHDVRVALTPGTYVDEGMLAAQARGIAHAEQLVAVEERLILSTQVDASQGGKTVLVPGRIVGAEAEAVDRVHQFSGADGATVRLEQKFAAFYDLPSTGTVEVSGGETVAYDGLGVSPEYFRVADRAAGIYGHSNFAVLFTDVQGAQELGDQPGKVNDLVVRVFPGADVDQIAKELATATAVWSGEAAVGAEDPGREALYGDADNDQQTWDLFAVLILLGAAFASFNLVSRIVEAERRQIGVGMALGVTPRTLAVRHLLVAAQVALLGVVLGVGVGILTGNTMRNLYMDLQPLPIWETPFPAGRYLAAAALGLALPVAATILPVRRAVRVEPAQAFRSTAYSAAAAGGGLIDLVGTRPIKGNIVRQLAFRNLMRAPRRTLFTALGIAGAMAALVAVLGLLDSYVGTAARADEELTRMAPDRVLVGLNGFYDTDDPVLTRVERDDAVGEVEPVLLVVGQLRANGERILVTPELIDLRDGMWLPSFHDPVGDPASGIVLADKAARDLGVRPGDTVLLRHPRALTDTAYALVNHRFVVTAIHPAPVRVFNFLDRSQAGLFGLDGKANALFVRPAAGVDGDTLRRALFELPGVTSTQTMGLTTKAVRQQLEGVVGILRVVEVGVLLLAVVIAFNSASITVDERVREEATMFAFGLPLRAVLGLLVIESAVTGLLGTALGLGAGYGVMRWMVDVQLSNAVPELGVYPTLTGGSIAAVLVLGVGAVAAAPLFMARRLHRMDIPGALRVVE